MSDHLTTPWRRTRNAAFAVGGAASIGSALLAWGEPTTCLQGYLIAFLGPCLVTAGSLGLLAVGNLTGGRWAVASRPLFLAAVDTTPLIAVLFVPIALGVEYVYPWAAVEGHFDFQDSKAAWLSKDFFIARSVAYFVAWLAAATLLARLSHYQRTPGETTGMRRAGALGLLILILVITFAMFDWGMSLKPEWYSSIYGAILAISGVVAAQSLVAHQLSRFRDEDIVLPFNAITVRADHGPLPEPAVFASHLRGDVANLLLAFVMLWAYFSFSQFLIIWSGNLPTEITWYLNRLEGGWQWLIAAIAALHFALPFMLLASRGVKQSRGGLRAVTWLLLSMYLVNLFWTIKPSFAPGGFAIDVADVVCVAALGGLWTGTFFWRLEKRWNAIPA